jgi:hypothetical protein
MLKINHKNKLNEILTCDKCKRFYLEPVILPCKKNICKSHVFQESNNDNNIYKCDFCKDDHHVPKNGFILNETANEILKLNLHLKDKAKEAYDLIDEFDEILNDLISLSKDPENFIYEYISFTRNKIDLKRERLVLKINNISDELLHQLKVFEEKCKLNLINNNNQLTVNFNQTHYEKFSKISWNWKEEFRKPHLNDQHIDNLFNEINKLLKENRHKNIELKSNLLIGRGCYFKSKEIDQNHFGELNFDDYELIYSFDQEKSLFNSTILQHEQSFELIKLCEFNWKSKFTLIYRATVDGFEAFNFHRKCNGIPNTLSIIKVKDSKNIFGGYTQATWDNSNTYKKDNNAFIFSLVNQDNKPIKINFDSKNGSSYSIKCNSTFGPTFGAGFDIFISTHSNCTIASYSNLGYSFLHPLYHYGSEEAKNFLAGSYRFSLNEIEVYRID